MTLLFHLSKRKLVLLVPISAFRQIILANHHCKEENKQIHSHNHIEVTEAWEIWVLLFTYSLYTHDILVVQFLLLFLGMAIFYYSFS